MSEETSPHWPHVKTMLTRAFPQLYELEAEGPLALELGDDGWLLEIRPDGRLLCQYGVAMDDVKSLMSDGTPEDLGTDEIAKQAKYFIQPAVSRFRPLLLKSGFAEELDMNEDYVAVIFGRAVDLQNLAAVQDLVRWCRQQFGAAV